MSIGKSTPWQVGRIVNHQWPFVDHPKDRLVGIELEYEGVTGITLGEPHSNTKAHITPEWYAVKDGSLRNHGGEFVSVPLERSKVLSSLDTLFWTPGATKWKTSIRTGLHGHVDVRDFSIENLKSLSTGICLIEPALFSYVGLDREENIFCVPWYRAPNDCLRITEWLNDKRCPITAFNYLDHLAKYDAINWQPLLKYGTVEFRQAPCTTDINQINEWIQICADVVELGIKYTQKELLQLYVSSPDDFPRTVHPKLHTPDYESVMLRTNAEWLAQKTVEHTQPFDPADKTAWVRLMDKIPYKNENKEGSYVRKLRQPKAIPQAQAWGWNPTPLTTAQLTVSAQQIQALHQGFQALPTFAASDPDSTDIDF